MEIRLAKESEKEELRLLWKEVFDEDEFYLEYKFDKEFTPLQSVIVWDEKIIGAAHFDIVFMNNKKVAYINGVSIKKEFRGRNISIQMMDYLHKYLKDTGFSFCFLKPAISNYYERFGYKTIYSGKHYVLEEKSCLPYEPTLDGIEEIFSAAAKSCEIYLLRSNENFEKLRTLYKNYGGNFLAFKRDNKLLGYALFYPENEKTVIDEFVFLSDDGENILSDYFKTKVLINELPVMIKDLNEEFCYKSSFIKVI